MREIAISKFKATCLAVMEEVGKSRKPVRVTKFGVPVADVIPPALPMPAGHWLGCMAGTGKIVGDIVGPVTDPDDWDALR